MGQRGVRGPRQDEEESGRQKQDADRNERRKRRQPGVEVAHSAARRGVYGVHGAADFVAGERGDGEQQEQRQTEEEIESGGENRRRQQLQKGDDGRVEVVAIGDGSEDLYHRQEEHQVNRGREQVVRKEKVVGREEQDIGQRDDSDGAFGNVALKESADQQAAQQ